MWARTYKLFLAEYILCLIIDEIIIISNTHSVQKEI